MTQGVQPLGGGDLETFYSIVTLIYKLDKLISHKNSILSWKSTGHLYKYRF